MHTSQVSVVIPAFCASAHIRRAVDSALSQSVEPLEVVVVDDASPDGTSLAAAGSHDSRVRVIRLVQNVGASEARNIGVREARGSVVAFLDADDEWHPQKLERQLPLLSPATTLVACDARIVGSDGRSERFSDRCPPVVGESAWRGLLRQNFIPTPTVVCRRDDILAAGLFDASLTIGEDLDLWIRLARRGSVSVVREELVTVYTQATGLMRSNPRGELEDVLPMIDRHLNALKSELGLRDYRRIRGERAFDVAYRLFRAGMILEALPLFARAAGAGVRVTKSLGFFPLGALRLLMRPSVLTLVPKGDRSE